MCVCTGFSGVARLGRDHGPLVDAFLHVLQHRQQFRHTCREPGWEYIYVVLCTLHVGKENHGFENLDFGKKKIPAETAPQEEQVEHIISTSNHLTIWSTG